MRIFKIGLIILLFFITSCGKSVQTTEEECEVPQPFYLEFVANGIIIYPDVEVDMERISSATFFFYLVTISGLQCIDNVRYGLPYSYNYPLSSSVGFFEIGENKFGKLEIDIAYKCSNKEIRSAKFFSCDLVGTKRVKFAPFLDFDSPLFSVFSYQSEDNYLFFQRAVTDITDQEKICYSGWVYHLSSKIDRFIPVKFDGEKLYGCYTKLGVNGIYCDTMSGETEVTDINPEKFYTDYLDKGIFRVYVLKDNNFKVYDLIDGNVTRTYEENNVKDIFPVLDAVHLGWEIGNSFAGVLSGNNVTNNRILAGKRLFFVQKTTDENVVEVLSPGYWKKYISYWSRVSSVAYSFADYSHDITDSFVPGGVIFKDGSVYLRNYDKQYFFPEHVVKVLTFNKKVSTPIYVSKIPVYDIVITTGSYYFTGNGYDFYRAAILGAYGNSLSKNEFMIIGSDGSLGIITPDFLDFDRDQTFLMSWNTFLYGSMFGWKNEMSCGIDQIKAVSPFLPAYSKYLVKFERVKVPDVTSGTRTTMKK